MNLYEKLSLIQSEINVPKKHHNDFGSFYFRSAEDILEAFKPLGEKHKVTLVLADDVEEHCGDAYITATVKIVNLENIEEFIEVTASAREDKNKGKMDASQMSGSCSSYARKYALNGLFLLDDCKDPDDMKPEEGTKQKTNQAGGITLASSKQVEILARAYTGDNLTKLLQANNITKLEEMPKQKASELIEKLFEKGKKE